VSHARPPGGYRFGEGRDSVVVVPARVAAWLIRHTDLAKVRIAARGTDPELYAVLHDVYTAALGWRASATAGSIPTATAEVEPPSSISTTQAAGLLGVTDRAIRMAITTGRLPAERDGNRWRIDREDFEHYRATRVA